MKKIYPFEAVTIAVILICILAGLIFKIPIIPIRPWIVEHFINYLGKIFIFLTIILILKILILKNSNKINYESNLTSKKIILENIFLILRFLICLELVFTCYTTIKQAIPFLNPDLFDNELLKIDQFLHFGFSPSAFISDNAHFKQFNKLLDKFYLFWFSAKILLLSYFLIHFSKTKKHIFLSSYLMIWIIGVFTGAIFPSLGPFALKLTNLPAAGMDFSCAAQNILLNIYQAKLPITFSGNGNMFFGYGLMAFPSLHVTACILYFYFLKDENEILKYLSLVFLIIIFAGSIYSGWHYALDGYFGIIIVLISVKTAKYLVHTRNFKT
jgi:hypothetical protein